MATQAKLSLTAAENCELDRVNTVCPDWASTWTAGDTFLDFTFMPGEAVADLTTA